MKKYPIILLILLPLLLCACSSDDDDPAAVAPDDPGYVQAQRLLGLSALYECALRQPESIPNLVVAAGEMTGDVDERLLLNNEAMQAARLESFGPLYRSAARVCPEAIADMVDCALKISGPGGDPATFTPAVEAARLRSLAGLYDGLGHDPTAGDKVLTAVGRLSGTTAAPRALADETVQVARMESFAPLYMSISSHAEAQTIADMVACALRLGGPAGAPDTFTPAVEAARLRSFAGLYKAVIRNPEMNTKLFQAARDLTGDITYDRAITDEIVQIARLESFAVLYRDMSLNPDCYNYLKEWAIELSGPAADPAACSPAVRAARLRSFTGLYEALGRRPTAQFETRILEVARALSGTSPSPPASGETLQTARLRSFAGLYQALGSDAAQRDMLVATARELSGDIDEELLSTSEAMQIARLESFSNLYQAIGRYPQEADKLVVCALQLSGPAADPATCSPAVQAARLRSFAGLYGALGNHPEAKTQLLEAARQLSGEIDYPEVITDEIMQSARLESFSPLYASLSDALKTEAADLQACALSLGGPAPDAGRLSRRAAGARMLSLRGLYEAISFQPGNSALLVDTAKALCGSLADDGDE